LPESEGLEDENEVAGRNTPPQHIENEDGNREINGNGEEVLLGDQLCPCTTTTEGDAFLMCLALGMRHNMTWLAIVDTLKMINKLFNREVINASKYYLMKFFESGKESTTVHIYCPVCEAYLGTKDFVAEHQVLQCNCGEEVKSIGQSLSYFVSLNLKDEFKVLMEDPAVAQEIKTYRFDRRKINNDAIEDFFDGDEYKRLGAVGQPLAEPNNFSVTINTDGMALGASSKQSAWPIFMHVNELSPKNRKKHLIFGGLWVGKKQPNMRIFLKPFANDMKEIMTAGFSWTDVNGDRQVSRVLPVTAVLDSGARYKFLNLHAHSAYYGCTFCYQKAENFKQLGRRFTIPETAAPLRTHESMLADMRIAYGRRDHRDHKLRTYRGCKGFTPLILMQPYLNLGSGILVDYMHNGLLGVTRHFTYLVLNATNTPLYIGDPDNMAILNGRLMRIRPPRSITRTPRSLSECKIWHANEWRSFLIFYGPVCFEGVLKKRKYLELFSMLSAAFNILLQKSITKDELDTAERYLHQYVYLAQLHFGKKQMVYNIHLLLHVVAAVRNWGPIWAHNTFVFEGENRHLGQMHTSPGRIGLQLTRRYLIYRSFPKLCEKYATTEAPVEFIEDITGKKYRSFLRYGETVLVGKGLSHVLNLEETLLIRESGIPPDYLDDCNVLSFSRMLHNGIRYTTGQYSLGKKNDDSWVKLSSSVRGSIEKILHLQLLEEQHVFVFLKEVRVSRAPFLRSADVTVTHIKRIEGGGDIKVARPCDIVAQCIYIDLDTGNFIVDIPFGCYGD
jgi:hypothetical protein